MDESKKVRQRKRDILKMTLHRKNNQVKRWLGLSTGNSPTTNKEDSVETAETVTTEQVPVGSPREEEKKSGDLFDTFDEKDAPTHTLRSSKTAPPMSEPYSPGPKIGEHLARRSSSHGSSGSLCAADARSRGASHGRGSILAMGLAEGQRFELLVDPIPPSDRNSLVNLSQTWKNMRRKSVDSEPGMQILYASLELLMRFLLGSRGGGHWDAFLTCYNQFTSTDTVLGLLEMYLKKEDPSNLDFTHLFVNNRPRPSLSSSWSEISTSNSMTLDKDKGKDPDHENAGQTMEKVQGSLAADTRGENDDGQTGLETCDSIETAHSSTTSDSSSSDVTLSPGGTEEEELQEERQVCARQLFLIPTEDGTLAIGSEPVPLEETDDKQDTLKSRGQREYLKRAIKELGLDADFDLMQENAHDFAMYWLRSDAGCETLTEEQIERVEKSLAKAEEELCSVLYTQRKDSWDANSEPEASFPPHVESFSSDTGLNVPVASPIYEDQALALPPPPPSASEMGESGTGLIACPPVPQSLQVDSFSETSSSKGSRHSLRQKKSPTFKIHARSRSLSHGWKRKKANSHASTSSTESRKVTERGLVRCSAAEVAHCLTWSLYEECYKHIRAKDLITKKSRESNPYVRRMIEVFDKYSWWPLTWIFDKDVEILQRVDRVIFFLDVATECRKLHNFHTFFGIVAGLSQPMMTWLWDFLKEKDKSRFEDLKRAVKNKGDYRVYRADLSKCSNKSHIPFLGLTTKLLFPLEHDIDAVSVDQPHMVNFGRCVSMQHTINDFLKGQLLGYESDLIGFDEESSHIGRVSGDSVDSVSIGSPLSHTGRKTTSVSSEQGPSPIGSPTGYAPQPFSSPQHQLQQPLGGAKPVRGNSICAASVGSGVNLPTRLRVTLEVVKAVDHGMANVQTKQRIEKNSADLKKRLCEDLVMTLESSGFM